MTEQEFQTFLRSIRPADRAAMDAAARRQAELAKPPGSLGALEDVSIRLAGLTGPGEKSDRPLPRARVRGG